MKSKVLTILLPSGEPNELKMLEIPGWSGRCFVVPRQSIKQLKDRVEAYLPGVYFLFGVNEETSEDMVYIGESENFFTRITNHDANKDFWNDAVVFTGGLNRAFVKYLEYRATEGARDAKRMNVQNKVQPQKNTLSESEKVVVERYFENVQFVLRAIGYSIFDLSEESVKSETVYYMRVDGVDAQAQLLKNGNLKVFKGSTARIKETASFVGWARTARQNYLERRILELAEDKEAYVLTEDVIFKSPSAASATLAGRAINGWTAWRDQAGKTLDENVRQ